MSDKGTERRRKKEEVERELEGTSERVEMRENERERE